MAGSFLYSQHNVRDPQHTTYWCWLTAEKHTLWMTTPAPPKHTYTRAHAFARTHTHTHTHNVVINKLIIKPFLTSNSCFQLKYEYSVHNYCFLQWKSSQPESGEKYAQIKHRLQAKQLHMSVYLMAWRKRTTGGMTFSLEEVLLWTLDQKWGFELTNYYIKVLFLTNIQLFTLEDVNWWTGVVWIIVMFLSAVCTLILTAPIHFRASIGELMQSDAMQNFSRSVLMKKQTHLHLEWPVSEYIFGIYF